MCWDDELGRTCQCGGLWSEKTVTDDYCPPQSAESGDLQYRPSSSTTARSVQSAKKNPQEQSRSLGKLDRFVASDCNCLFRVWEEEVSLGAIPQRKSISRKASTEEESKKEGSGENEIPKEELLFWKQCSNLLLILMPIGGVKKLAILHSHTETFTFARKYKYCLFLSNCTCFALFCRLPRTFLSRAGGELAITQESRLFDGPFSILSYDAKEHSAKWPETMLFHVKHFCPDYWIAEHLQLASSAFFQKMP